MDYSLRFKVSAALSTLAVFLGTGTIAYHFLEGWTWTTSFYFSVVTLSTVGYGNLYPTTTASQLFTSFYILIGVAAVVASLGIIGSAILDRREAKLINKMEEKNRALDD